MADPATSSPLISVALCTYNGARYLRDQLESVLAQSGVAIEIVAVDDGSQDETPAILEAFAARDPRVRWQANQRNLGPTASFERAMALCRGEFIAPCDQDDLWHPEKLASLIAAIGDCDLVYCDSDFMTAEGQSMRHRLSEGMAMLRGKSPTTFLFANSVSGHASLLRRDLFERARPFPAGAYHDWWLALCAAGGNGVGYLDRPLVRFRRHASAYSPMGKSSGGAARSGAASREWLEQRHVLMQAYAGTSFRDTDSARALAHALRSAIDGGSSRALMHLVWRHRAELPRWKGSHVIDALKWQMRLSKKLRRARSGMDGGES